jgi:hypothetical protein
VNTLALPRYPLRSARCHPSLSHTVFQVLSNISSKSPGEQDEYLSAAGMTFTTTSPLADLLDLSASGSGVFTPEQSRCLAHTIARLRQGIQSKDADAALRVPVKWMDLDTAAAQPVTHANFEEYQACLAETLCWNNSLALLTAMRDGHVTPASTAHLCSVTAPLTFLQVRGLHACQRAASQACRRRARGFIRTLRMSHRSCLH